MSKVVLDMKNTEKLCMVFCNILSYDFSNGFDDNLDYVH